METSLSKAFRPSKTPKRHVWVTRNVNVLMILDAMVVPGIHIKALVFLPVMDLAHGPKVTLFVLYLTENPFLQNFLLLTKTYTHFIFPNYVK